MIEVLIADDHAVVREGLKQILSETSDIVVADEAGDGNEVLKKVKERDYDVIILDISMPGLNGIDTLKRLKSDKPNIPVLLLSVLSEEQYAVQLLRMGAFGFLTKDRAPEELIEAIRKVSRGRKYITETLAEKLAFDLEIESAGPLHGSLSNREYQVLCMIGSGKTVKEIAEELSLSVKTISTYRSRILEKMGMRNNAEITHYAIKNRLLDKQEPYFSFE